MKEKKQSIIDRRMVYIMPSIVALAIALTSLLYQFGDELVDKYCRVFSGNASCQECITNENCKCPGYLHVDYF